MAVAILDARQQVVQKEKEDPLDKIIKALQIAQSGFGIATDYQSIQKLKAEKALTQQETNRKADLENADSESSKKIVSQYANYGIKIPEGSSAADAEKMAGPLSKVASDYRSRQITPYQEQYLGIQKAGQKQSADLAREKIAADAANSDKKAKYDKSIIKDQREFANRYSSIIDELDNVESQIDESGTFDLIGPENEILKQKIASIAVDSAKLFDPSSVARPSEVAKFEESLIKPTPFMQDKTAAQIVQSYKAMIKDRAKREAENAGMSDFASRIDELTIKNQKKSPTDNDISDDDLDLTLKALMEL